MDYSVQASGPLEKVATDCLIVCLHQPSKAGALAGSAKDLDDRMKGELKSIAKAGDLHGNTAHALTLYSPQGLKAKRLILVGLGDSKKYDADAQRKVITAIAKKLHSPKYKTVSIVAADAQQDSLSQAGFAQALGQAIASEQYRYDTTKSEKSKKSNLSKIQLILGDAKSKKSLSSALNTGAAIGRGMNTTKELGNLPGNFCTPSILAKKSQVLAKGNKKLSVKVLGETEMKKLKMGSLLSVSAGSVEGAKLIAIEYNGAAKSKKPYVLVGKGVTFDTGGISLKPGAKMDEMKYDMLGAASVVGTLQAIAEIEPNINVVGLIGATENMPNGNATKPGDVVTSMSGQTIEVLNTDAEGRLVLCDVLTYAAKYKPETVIDIATLTGACVVALGSHATALYSNDDSFAEILLDAGTKCHDRAWHMPLWEEYDKQLNTKYADIANIGGPEGGSITAACFLARFTKDYTWAHLDIAGTAWSNKAASGRPVPMLTQYLLDQA